MADLGNYGAAIKGTLDRGTIPAFNPSEDYLLRSKVTQAVRAELNLPEDGHLDFHTIVLTPDGEVDRTRWHIRYFFDANLCPVTNNGPQPLIGLGLLRYDYSSGLAVDTGSVRRVDYNGLENVHVNSAIAALILRHYWGPTPTRSFTVPGVGTATFTAERLLYDEAWDWKLSFPYDQDPLLGVPLAPAMNGYYLWLVLDDGVSLAWPVSYVAPRWFDGPEKRLDPPAPPMPTFTPVPWPIHQPA